MRILHTLNDHKHGCDHPDCDSMAWYRTVQHGRAVFVCDVHHRWTRPADDPWPSDALLRDALLRVGLEDLAALAAAGEYNDFFSPHAQPKQKLIRILQSRVGVPDQLIRRVAGGEFDSGASEGEAWAASEHGQAVLRELMACACHPTDREECRVG